MLKFSAYLDDMSTIVCMMRNDYYGGFSDKLYLIADGFREKLEVTHLEKSEACTAYHCHFEGEIEFGKEYFVQNAYTFQTPIVYRRVVKTKEFDVRFFYDEDDLGNTYTPDLTSFKVWTPVATEVILKYYYEGKWHNETMTRTEKGVYSCEVYKDLDGSMYSYLVKVNGAWNESTDPYAYSSNSNNRYSYVIDLDKTNVDLNKNLLPKFEKYTDAIIYEISVRDFSVEKSVPFINRGKFLGMIEEGLKTQGGNPAGIDYLKDIGITHLQLMPIYDFATVDEDDQFSVYNWGYDPSNYNVPEGSYITDPHDPYARVIELKQLVAAYHQAGIRLNMDVVYNHMYDINSNPFTSLVPFYYFRYDQNFYPSNGSFCGNDVASEQLMVRKFIKNSIRRWAEFYGMDGFRFDLMGILDITTMNSIRKMLDKIDPSTMMYGEGWNMPTVLPNNEKSTMYNWMRLPRIGFFNDRYRDGIKGSTSEHDLSEQGFIGGNLFKTNIAVQGVLGSIFPNIDTDRLFGEVIHTVNYIECHDNHTVFDKLTVTNNHEEKFMIKRRATLGFTMVLLSQGIPFIHAGQEYFLSKKMHGNTYMSPDSINQFDWADLDRNIDAVNYFKTIISIRKKYSSLRFDDVEDIYLNVDCMSCSDGLLEYKLKEPDENKELIIYFNANVEAKVVTPPSEILVLVEGYEHNIDGLYSTEKDISIEPCTTLIFEIETKKGN